MTTQHRIRQILIHGLLQVMVGLLWGIAIPHTPFPRLALGAHIQFVSSGLLFIAMATILLTIPNRVGPKSVAVMVIAPWLTWLMASSEIANAWWGTNQMLPISGAQAGATGAVAWQELVEKVTHIAAALALLAAWGLLVVGFLKRKEGE